MLTEGAVLKEGIQNVIKMSIITMGVTSSTSSAQELYQESISVRISNPESSFALSVWVGSCQEFCQDPSRFWYWLWKRHASYRKMFAGRVARNVSMPASLSLQFDWWGHRLHCSIVWSGVELSLSVYTSLHNYFCLLLSSGFQEPCTQCHTGGAHAATTRSTEIKSVR